MFKQSTHVPTLALEHTIERTVPRLKKRDAPYESAEAFRTLYAHTHRSIYRFVYSLHGGPVETVEDLTAETFERAWKARHRFRNDGSTGDEDAAMGWLITIARNLVFDARRRQKRRQPDVTLEDAEQIADAAQGDGAERLLWSEEQALLLSMLQTLPDEERELLVLRYVLDWRVKRIAAHAGLKENTASVKIKRALERLRREWPDGE